MCSLRSLGSMVPPFLSALLEEAVYHTHNNLRIVVGSGHVCSMVQPHSRYQWHRISHRHFYLLSSYSTLSRLSRFSDTLLPLQLVYRWKHLSHALSGFDGLRHLSQLFHQYSPPYLQLLLYLSLIHI